MKVYRFKFIGLVLLASTLGVTMGCKKKKDDNNPPATPKGELELYLNPVS